MEIQESLMPREKMQRYGIEVLSDIELLALFLRTGTRTQDVMTFSRELLQRFWLAVRPVIGGGVAVCRGGRHWPGEICAAKRDR